MRFGWDSVSKIKIMSQWFGVSMNIGEQNVTVLLKIAAWALQPKQFQAKTVVIQKKLKNRLHEEVEVEIRSPD